MNSKSERLAKGWLWVGKKSPVFFNVTYTAIMSFMSYDPNWFYSSLAQCSAAIVGLLGAVLATRLQGQLIEARTSSSEILKMINQFGLALYSRSLDVETFVKFADERINQINTALRQRRKTIQVTREVSFWGESRTFESSSINTTEPDLHQLGNLRELAAEFSNISGQRLISVEDATSIGKALESVKKKLPPHVEKSVLENFESIVRNIENTNESHRRNCSVGLPLLLVIVLAWLCIVGLIAPLGFLTAYDPLSRNIFLFCASLGVIAIPVFIGWEVWRIHKLKHVGTSYES